MMSNIDGNTDQLRQQTPASSTRADSDFEMVGGEDDGRRRRTGKGGGLRTSMRTSGPDQASATRLIVLGFEKPLLEASLKDSVADLVQQCCPLGDEPIVRAYSLTRKVVLDLSNTLSCTALFGKSQTIGKFASQNPLTDLVGLFVLGVTSLQRAVNCSTTLG